MGKLFSAIKSCSWFKIFIFFIAISCTVRTILLAQVITEVGAAPATIAEIYIIGLFFDCATLLYFAAIPFLYYLLLPNRIFNANFHQKLLRVFYFLFILIIVFSGFSEWFFFDEFQTRFNFIAVDYLIYTTEVVGNIFESYPMPLLLTIIGVVSALIFFFSYKKVVTQKSDNFIFKLKIFAGLILALIGAFLFIDRAQFQKINSNNYANELMSNGIYQLFSAYRNNQIDYDQLYKTLPIKDVFLELRKSISSQDNSTKFLNEDDISRIIFAKEKGGEKKYNIMFVVMESFNADFMTHFGNKENIAPNLDNLAKKGLFFTNLKATGTRTVRGLEALSLSIPPTPGNSIVRRQNNENLFNISSPLKQRGYESKFIYGGFGYFDNMNYFFENNGFEIVDRDAFLEDEISFENSWGVADEDLFDKAIKEADKSYENGKPFLNFIMTTSNHRPFTYPDGKIDIASKTGRNGAVKYSDYAVGKLVEKARAKKWFDNTIFVFVSDHCAGSAGNSDVPIWRYQIPAIFYAPKIIKPQIFDQNISQIDIAPTLFGIMNFTYKSKFFGVDVLSNKKIIDRHSFVSTYTDIGYFEDDMLYLLKPKKEVKFFNVKFTNFGWQGSKEVATNSFSEEELKEVIAYYQGASHLFKNGKLQDFQENLSNK
jgi:phosphoglycerol transferase MdoB-like AlkP superfamily enzyme